MILLRVVAPLFSWSQGGGELVSVAGAQRIMLINVALILALAAFFTVVVLELARRSTRQRVEAARLAAMGTATGQLLHQVKNPLQTILLHAELLEDELMSGDDESRRELCQAIVGEAARMADLLGRLSTFASGVGQQLEARPTSLHDVVRAAARQYTREFEAAGLLLEVGQVAEVVTSGDQVFLLQALSNVLRNSYEELRERPGSRGGRVDISLRRRGAGAVIEVRDDGAGVAETELGTIFEPFMTRKRSGLGLGLPMAREIVEGHGGRIEIRSRPGIGTSVALILPIRAAAAPAELPA
jgi:signal transduction histidine kinase